MFTFINIKDIFKNQTKILNKCPENRWVFIYLPIIIGIVVSVLFYNDNKSILGPLTLFISIFVPLFANMLSILISFAMNKIKTRHNKERIPLIEETFLSICYLIPLALILVALSLLMHITILDNYTLKTFSFNYFEIKITVYMLYHIPIAIIFYAFFTHLFMILLMITKRIYKLIKAEIYLLTNDKNE